jgi:glucuronoarabinoxylan endo-1,4-beta-xylanase
MNRVVNAIVLFVTIMFLGAGRVSAQNLAGNPGFETGTTTGWSGFGSPTLQVETTQVHSGTYACLVANRTATYMGASQPFLGVLVTNQTYNVSVWLQLVSGASQTVQVTAQKIDGAGTTFAAIASGLVSTGTWTQVAGQYTLSVSNVLNNLTFYVEVPGSATVSYYIDDLTVSGPSTNGQTVVDAVNVHQRIDGFGASSAWNSSWSTAQGNMFFSTNVAGTGTSFDGKTNFSFNSIGLSLLRTRIAPGGTTVENSIMVMAQARGARVWSTPWSPAANFKSNSNVNGGSIVGTTNTYLAYASQLATYVVNMQKTYGINLYALSVQNEPDANVTTYESCNWTGQQIHDFIPYLSSALMASNVASTKIMLPESQNWQDPASLAVTAMTDSSTSNLVSIIADHNYDGTTGPSSLVKNSYGKALWETEVALLNGSDSSITNAVYYAGRIHLFMTVAQVNAWHYWWLVAGGTASNEGLTDTNGVPAKRMYALGQFSRFVRPGFNRVNTAGSGDAEVSAYKDATSLGFAIVAVNPDANAINQVFTLTNFNASTVTPWMTTSNQSLVQQSSIAVTNQVFTYTLPALSIVTFVGRALTNTPAVFNAIATQTINAGAIFAITNVATDTDSPPQTLTFSLLNAPSGAALNTANGIFTWRPTVAQANSINPVAVVVTDNGLPPLSATNLFTVQVNPLVAPVMSPVTSVGGGLGFSVNGPSGPDYTLLVSTNLTQWQALYTSNSPALPVMLLDTNPASAPQRFYRIQIEP